jgi:deoxyxylulose-5-phosphate synthase
MPWLHIGIPDRCIEHGSRQDCLEAAGLDAAAIAATIERWRAQVPALKLPRAATKLTAAGGAGTL